MPEQAGRPGAGRYIVWNAVPWYVSATGKAVNATEADARAVVPYLHQFVILFTELRVVVVMMGGFAEHSWLRYLRLPGSPVLRLITAPHPSASVRRSPPRLRAGHRDRHDQGTGRRTPVIAIRRASSRIRLCRDVRVQSVRRVVLATRVVHVGIEAARLFAIQDDEVHAADGLRVVRRPEVPGGADGVAECPGRSREREPGPRESALKRVAGERPIAALRGRGERGIATRPEQDIPPADQALTR